MQETPKWQRSGLTHGVLYMVIHFKRLACSGRRHRYSHHRSPIYRRLTSIMKCITGTTGRLVELIRYWPDQWTPIHIHEHLYYMFIQFRFWYCHILHLLTHASLLHHEDYYYDTWHTHGIKLVPAIVLLSPGLDSFQTQVSIEIQMRRVLVMLGGDIYRVIQT